MNDRELLELAAKAAQIVRLDFGKGTILTCGQDGHTTPWNPLEDDGDALRLAVALRLNIHYGHAGEGPIHCGQYAKGGVEEWGVTDPESTRRAIVRAAAEIGKAMP